jgi:hypothetical protein
MLWKQRSVRSALRPRIRKSEREGDEGGHPIQLVPRLPVPGFTLPLADQLLVFVLFRVERSYAATRVPFFFV